VAEHHPARYESLTLNEAVDLTQPSVEVDVYVWCYTLLVVHPRKEEEEDPR